MRRHQLKSEYWMALLGAGALLAACGGTTQEEKKVSALNLQSGEIQTFGSEGAVPDGWGICADPECTIFPPDFPCQVLGPAACLLNPDCRLKARVDLYIDGIGIDGGYAPDPTSPPHGHASEPGSDQAEACSGGATDASVGPWQSDPLPYPHPTPNPQIQLVCVPKSPLRSCDEIGDPQTCVAQPGCEWEQDYLHQPAAIDSSSCPQDDYDCPMPPSWGYCRSAVPQPCQELDEVSCSQRQDCDWRTGPCPMFCSIDDCDDYCRPFCQPNSCPDVEPPVCQQGEPVAQHDGNGCVIGYECVVECPELAPLPPERCDGKVEPIYDENGCLIGYRCVPLDACDELETEYQQVLELAKVCASYATGWEPDDGAHDPLPPPAFQCTQAVANGLRCPACPTYVNGANRRALSRLSQLQSQWTEARCDYDLACPAVICERPRGATCSPGSEPGQGSCTDLWGSSP